MIHHVPKFEQSGWSDDATLTMLCPQCGGNNLHQYTVHTFQRMEDGDKVVHTTAYMDGSEVKLVSNQQTNNPSSRRHGLTIEFECENCHWDVASDSFKLDIWQHKGTTYMVWRTE